MFPSQVTKCRGTVSDVAGFAKETMYWLRSWWFSNIPEDDAGKPRLSFTPAGQSAAHTVFIVETWAEVSDACDV